MTKFDLQLRDCLEGMSKLKTHSIDLVVTSPPYNLGIAYGKYFDRGKRSDYLLWCVRWATELRRVLKSRRLIFPESRRVTIESDAAARTAPEIP